MLYFYYQKVQLKYRMFQSVGYTSRLFLKRPECASRNPSLIVSRKFRSNWRKEDVSYLMEGLMWRRMAMMTACGVHIVTCRGEFTETNIFVNHVFSVLVGLQQNICLGKLFDFVNSPLFSPYIALINFFKNRPKKN